MVILDTGILYAAYDRSDRWHTRARKLLRSEQGALILPAPVIPELDYLLGRRLGADARFALYEGITGNHYYVAELPRDGYARVEALNRQFSDLDLGFVDAAVIAVGEGLGLLRIATTDRRHFEPLAKPLGLTLVP